MFQEIELPVQCTVLFIMTNSEILENMIKHIIIKFIIYLSLLLTKTDTNYFNLPNLISNVF